MNIPQNPIDSASPTSGSLSPALDRRQFLGAGGGLVLGLVLPSAGGLGAAQAASGDTRVNAWLAIGSNNAITLTIGSSDMGQGSFQGLAQILAEDLFVDPLTVRLEQGGPMLATPAPVGSAIVTAGSSVTRNNYWRLRDAAAIARETLVAAAMARIGDPTRANYSVAAGLIRHASSGQQLSYGQVADAASRLVPPTSAPLVPDAQFQSIGRALPRQDIPSKVDGSARYGLDVRLPGMVYAAVRHCPSLGGMLIVTPPVPTGAIAVVPLSVTPGIGRGAEQAGNVNAIAVVAGTTWDAMRLSRSLSPRWSVPAATSALSSANFMADAQHLMLAATPYVAGAANGPGTLHTVEASAEDPAVTLARSDTRALDATYALPYVAHGCMEVLNCTVDFVPDVSCTVYAPTQVARSALVLVMQITGLREDQVHIRTTLLGGGLGRKSELDFIAQAVKVGMAVKRPVQLMWPREEDFTHDQYRPMALVHVRAGLGPAQQLVGWSYRNVSPSILGQRGAVLGPTGDSQAYEGSQALPYQLGARRVEWVSHPSTVPVGFWRSVGASINTFAVESMIDELAAAAGQSPYAFRRSRLADARWIAVLDTVVAASGFNTTPAAGTARGIAVGTAFNTVVAMVVEVAGTSTSNFSVRRVWAAVDSVLTINPLNAEAQITGGIVHGLNAALYGQQTFVAGVAQRRNFDKNPVIRLQQMPTVSVTLMPRAGAADRSLPIGGIAELGVPTFAPALVNALFRLTGKRVRTLPLLPAATMGD